MSQIEQDLAYIKDIVKESEDSRSGPTSIYFLWAIVYFVGFSLFDVNPQTAGLFWTIAGPLGGLTSFWLGRRWAMRIGESSRRAGIRHLFHWSAMIVAIFLAVPLHATALISEDALARIILLLAAFGMFIAGNYLVRPYRWIGIAMAICYLSTIMLTNLSWLVVGALLGGSTLIIGLISLRSN